jgi:hypothetical protein
MTPALLFLALLAATTTACPHCIDAIAPCTQTFLSHHQNLTIPGPGPNQSYYAIADANGTLSSDLGTANATCFSHLLAADAVTLTCLSRAGCLVNWTAFPEEAPAATNEDPTVRDIVILAAVSLAVLPAILTIFILACRKRCCASTGAETRPYDPEV